MRKRSEVSKDTKKSEEPKPGPKPPAVERTAPLFTDAAGDSQVKCPACDDVNPLEKWTLRSDKKTRECPSCGAPLEALVAVGAADPAPDPDEVVVDEEGDARTRAEMNEKHDLPGPRPADVQTKGKAGPPRKTYCGECAAEWAVVDGHPWMNCGHAGAEGVDDPRKAKRWNPPAGIGTPRTPNIPQTAPVFPAGAEITFTGPKLHVSWGEARFPIDAYNNFKVGPFSITATLHPDERITETASRMLAELRAIAELAFAAERKWYEEHLVTLGTGK